MSDDGSLLTASVHRLTSAAVGDDFQVLVAGCGMPGAEPAQALYVLDPWFAFGTAVEIARLLAFAHDLPPLLLVGVGYDLATVPEHMQARERDLTHCADPDKGYPPETSGGAEAFASFLGDELQPWVADRFGVSAEDAGLFGDSLGGLFGTYVLLNRPGLFQRYGLGSPSYWYAGKNLFEQEEEYARTHTDLVARVHLSVGALENLAGERRWVDGLPPDRRAAGEAGADLDEPWDMVADTEEFAARLRSRGYPGLELTYECLADEYHQTAVPTNISRAMRHLYDAPL